MYIIYVAPDIYYLEPTEDILKTIEDIQERLFTIPLGEEQGVMLILCLARALSGIPQKKIIFGIGKDGNNGKSVLCIALEQALGDYAGGFDIKNFIQAENDSKDAGQMMRLALLARHKRIITSNENRTNENKNSKLKLTCELIKSITGGDALTGRLHSGNETSFVPHFIPFCLLTIKLILMEVYQMYSPVCGFLAFTKGMLMEIQKTILS